jgi:hypothetical protein
MINYWKYVSLQTLLQACAVFEGLCLAAEDAYTLMRSSLVLMIMHGTFDKPQAFHYFNYEAGV